MSARLTIEERLAKIAEDCEIDRHIAAQVAREYAAERTAPLVALLSEPWEDGGYVNFSLRRLAVQPDWPQRRTAALAAEKEAGQ